MEINENEEKFREITERASNGLQLDFDDLVLFSSCVWQESFTFFCYCMNNIVQMYFWPPLEFLEFAHACFCWINSVLKPNSLVSQRWVKFKWELRNHTCWISMFFFSHLSAMEQRKRLFKQKKIKRSTYIY